jgi:hypothetical protein
MFISKFVLCACAKSVAKNNVFKTARMWKPRIVLEKMGETRTTVRKKRTITEGGFRIFAVDGHAKECNRQQHYVHCLSRTDLTNHCIGLGKVALE